MRRRKGTSLVHVLLLAALFALAGCDAATPVPSPVVPAATPAPATPVPAVPTQTSAPTPTQQAPATSVPTQQPTAATVPTRAASAKVARVLLISVDGLHASDLSTFIKANPGSTLAALSLQGVTYSKASATIPSDSFPGLMAIVTGGSPRTTGVYYDDSYDRKLLPPINAKAGDKPGTEVVYDGSIDSQPDKLDGGGSINPDALPRDPVTKQPVFPHQFLRVNTIFEVIKAAGLPTAWTDKHLSYEIVNGPSGKGVDDLFTPEIDSSPITSFITATENYDDVKVGGVLNQINGKDHSGAKSAPVPAIFGMNFQAVSVGQKLPNNGYKDAQGAFSAGLAEALGHTDQSLGKMVTELKKNNLFDSTLIIITAKHGQSPIDPAQLQFVDKKFFGLADDAVAQMTTDDVALIWLTDQSKAADAVATITANKSKAMVQDVYTFASKSPAWAYTDPAADSRPPDILVQPVPGVIYTKPGKKIAEHGGGTPSDTNVALLVSYAGTAAQQLDAPVLTTQVAPTILKALGLDPNALQAVKAENTPILPGLPLPGASAAAGSIWTLAEGAPVPDTISGGPWTLAQLATGNPSPAAVTNKSFGYDASWLTANANKTGLMQPYYFPFTMGEGSNLQGYFDWRPKDINEAIVAAKSTDGGKSWQFQQAVLALTQAVPADQKATNPNADQADNGFGHPYVLSLNGTTYLYLLDRSNAAIDNLGLVINTLPATGGQPLGALPAIIPLLNPLTTDESKVTRTKGLLNPDGIIDVVPGSAPLKVLYVQKLKGGDNTGATALPANQQCETQPYIPFGDTKPRAANHDIINVRMATTTDGINFTDLGTVSGLYDSTATSYAATRYIGPRGTLLKLDAGRYGFFFSGGNCMDADSDAFHYIGYAETSDPTLKTWTVINGLNNPIVSTGTQNVPVNGVTTTIPAQTPVVGASLDWTRARVYSPSVTRFDANTFVLTFAGYQVQSPNNDLLHYRQIGSVRLKLAR